MQGWELENVDQELGKLEADEERCLTVKSTLPMSPDAMTKKQLENITKL